MVKRGNAQGKKRPHGVRAEDWEAMKQFEHAKQTDPYVPESVTVYVRPPCRCEKWPFAHYHDNLPIDADSKENKWLTSGSTPTSSEQHTNTPT